MIYRLCLTVMFALLSATVVNADNPFGLPEPESADRPGTIMLHGGGRISENVFRRFVALAGGTSAKIVLVPSAGFDTRHYDSRRDFDDALRYRYSAWFGLESRRQIENLTVLHTEDPYDADDPAFIAPLAKATAVWFTGGDQGRLNYRFVGGNEETQFQLELKSVLRRGGVIGGTSAGTAAIPEIMTLRATQDGDGQPFSARIAHGFGLMTRAIVEQHFDTRSGRLERFLGVLKDDDRLREWSRSANVAATMMGIAVDEPATAEICESGLRCWGPGHVHLFVKRDNSKTVEWHDLAPNETVNVELKKGRQGYTVTRSGDN